MRRRAAILILAALAPASQAQVSGRMRPCPAPFDTQASDCLGSAVAVDAVQLLAAARGRDANGSRAGGIARWVRDERTWQFDRWIDSPRPAAGQEFGHALSLRGTVLAVGAPSDDVRGADAGAAWVLAPSSSDGWAPRAELTPPNPEAGERFGATVATNGQRVAVGAPAATVGGCVAAGRVLVFEPSGSSFGAAVSIVAPSPSADRRFGEALACDGSWLVVGCPGDDGSGKDSGAVYAFRKTPLGWTLVQQLASPDPVADARFGQSVAIEGSRLWISEPRASQGGRVHRYDYVLGVFQRGGAIVNVEPGLLPDFGWSLACSGTRVIGGAPRAAPDGVPCGAAVLFDAPTPSTTSMLARLGPPTNGPADIVGTSVAISGTVIAFGAPGVEDGHPASGAVFAADMQFDCDGDGTADALAIAAGAGDLDLDGLPDACECQGDFDGNGGIDTADVALLLLDFGATGAGNVFDLDGNELVDTADISLLLLLFGPCP